MVDNVYTLSRNDMLRLSIRAEKPLLGCVRINPRWLRFFLKIAA